MKPAEPSTANSGRDHSAFTRIDLLVVIITLAVLAVTLLPALARTRVRPQGTQCLANLRQITLGWQMYANENKGNFPMNPTTTSPAIIDKLDWAPLLSDYNGNPDDTNAARLVNPKYSLLAPYVINPSVYKCPADPSKSFGLTGDPRVFTYDMSQTVGPGSDWSRNGPPPTSPQGQWAPIVGCGSPAGGGPGIYRSYDKDEDIVDPTPSDLFVFTEEDPDSKNNPDFAFRMPPNNGPASYAWVDYPAKFHNNCCNFGFADGHSEIHRWQQPGLIPAYTGQPVGEGLFPGAKVDCGWLARHVTAPAVGYHWPF